MMDYIAELCDRQHRLFVFMLSFVNDRARLIRFDRAGTSMTVEFDYALHPEIIGTFLYRLSLQDRAGRGYDPTVTPASEADAKLFRSLHTCYPPDSAVGRALADAVMESEGTADRDGASWPICKLTIEGPFTQDANRAVLPSDPVERREFLIGKPMSASRRALYGRGTKVYAAYDVATEKIVVIKDSWRPSSNKIRSEYDTYVLLNSAERPAGQPLLIPTLLGGGDVMWNGVVQETPTSAGRDSDTRTHFRLVLKEVCRPLEDFTNSLELVVAVLCAIDGTFFSARLGCDPASD
uniref:Toxin B (EC) n=1 Tax=Ganoderma boninense TaxID=34458 RepID=A0A5K1K7N8_9APHY|nr:Toxin B (EC [Ganoderma boninense]